MVYEGDNLKEKIFERKNELLQSALEEFAAKSYHNASLNLIIKNAHISKGTFYYHFTDKEELYLYLIKSAFYAKWEFIDKKARAEREIFNKGSIFEKFKIQAKFGSEFAAIYPLYYKLGNMLLMKTRVFMKQSKLILILIPIIFLPL